MLSICIGSISWCFFVVPLFRWCSSVSPFCSISIILSVFRYSTSVPVFRQFWCSGVLPVFLSGGIRVRIPHELDVVAFWSWNLNVILFSLGILMSWFFVLWKNTLESRCRGLFVSVSWCHGVLVPKYRCRGFLVLEFRYRDICASTASFSFSLNPFCHIINVDMEFLIDPIFLYLIT